jgi:RecA-family ATPase
MKQGSAMAPRQNENTPPSTLDASLGPDLADISQHLYTLFPPQFVQVHPDAQIEIAYGLANTGPSAARLFDAIGGLEAAAKFAYERSKAGCNCYIGPALRKAGLKRTKRTGKTDVSLTSFAWCDFDGEGDEARIKTLLKEVGVQPAVLVQTGTVPWIRFQIYFRLEHPLPTLEIETVNAALRAWLGGDDVGNADRVMRLAGTLSFPSQKKAERGYLVERTVLKLVTSAPRYTAEQLMNAAGGSGAPGHSTYTRNAVTDHLIKGNGQDRSIPYLAYAAETEVGRPLDELKALLEETRIEGNWHDRMKVVVASLVSKGWPEAAIRVFCGPYCERGENDRDLSKLLEGPYRKGWGGDAALPLKGTSSAITDRLRSYPSEQTKNDRPIWQPPEWLDMSDWDHIPVPEREWAIEDRVPLNQAGLFSGEGGTGKSIIELMKDVAHVAAKDWMGSLPAPGGAFYIGCEDDKKEIHIRLAAILKNAELTFAEVIAGGLKVLPLLGQDAVLCAANPRTGRVEATALYYWLYEMAGDLKPRNISVDTLSRAFAGNEIDRSQVYEFSMHMQALAKAASGSTTILSHPSLAGMASGSGLSGSTAWHGAFRFRQYLTTPRDDLSNNVTEDADNPASALRELQFKKNQYGPLGTSIILEYRNGLFLPVHGQSGLDRLAHKERSKTLFLELLERFNRQGVNVSHKKQSRNSAPNLFTETPEARKAKLRKDDFNTAMGELFAANLIHVEKYQSGNRYEYDRLVGGSL